MSVPWVQPRHPALLRVLSMVTSRPWVSLKAALLESCVKPSRLIAGQQPAHSPQARDQRPVLPTLQIPQQRHRPGQRPLQPSAPRAVTVAAKDGVWHSQDYQKGSDSTHCSCQHRAQLHTVLSPAAAGGTSRALGLQVPAPHWESDSFLPAPSLPLLPVTAVVFIFTPVVTSPGSSAKSHSAELAAAARTAAGLCSAMGLAAQPSPCPNPGFPVEDQCGPLLPVSPLPVCSHPSHSCWAGAVPSPAQCPHPSLQISTPALSPAPAINA